jgi:hypothetical protein
MILKPEFFENSDEIIQEIFVYLLNTIKKKYFQLEDYSFIETLRDYLIFSLNGNQ